MDRKERAIAAVEALKKVYPDALCSLSYEKPYELLISTRLSAQCTDKRVNIVTRELYAKYPTLQAIADAPLEEIEELLHKAGFKILDRYNYMTTEKGSEDSEKVLYCCAKEAE